MARFNRTLTITAGTYTRLSDFVTSAVAAEQLPESRAVNFSVQMMHGGTGIGYVMLGIPNGVTPNPATDGHLTAEVAPASSTAPGGQFYQNQQAFGSPLAATVDLSKAWVGGSVTSDKMIVTWDSTP